mmetsp:Transcript_5448/g.6340  ORF Transcript_5448/g.6340 Transcript_5448/m.6340 type:complete len:370 (-) Transcript_5448:1169-2278(-)
MGNAPLRPTEEQLKNLNKNLDFGYRQSAEKLNSADVLIVLAGAGFSADSGLPTYDDFRDVEAYKKSKLEYHDICRLSWLEEDAELFWGFWGNCFNGARTHKPHLGYSILKRWRDEYFGEENGLAVNIKNRVYKTSPTEVASAGAFYFFTTNVDAHSHNFFQPEEIRERYGNIETYQCSQPCSHNRWKAPLNHSFNVDKKSMRAKSREIPSVSFRETKLTDDDCSSALAKESFREDEVVCPRCNGHARPAVLMFDDDQWIDCQIQAKSWANWVEHLVAEVKETYAVTGTERNIVLLEIGAGSNVTTCREQTENLFQLLDKANANVTLIRVNPEFPLPDTQSIKLAKNTISLSGTGFKSLQAIDERWKAMC